MHVCCVALLARRGAASLPEDVPKGLADHPTPISGSHRPGMAADVNAIPLDKSQLFERRPRRGELSRRSCTAVTPPAVAERDWSSQFSTHNQVSSGLHYGRILMGVQNQVGPRALHLLHPAQHCERVAKVFDALDANQSDHVVVAGGHEDPGDVFGVREITRAMSAGEAVPTKPNMTSASTAIPNMA